jgi:uncharacterized protein
MPHEKPTTSSSNVAVIERLYEAFRRRDLPAIFALLSEDVEIYQSSALSWGGSYRGHDGAATFFTKLVTASTSTVTVERFVDAGDHVVAIGWTRGTANASGAAFDVPVAHVWALRDGRVVRVEYFIDNPTMLAAL